MFNAQGDGFLGHHQTNPIGQPSREQAPDLLQSELTQSQEESQSALKQAKEQRLVHQLRSLSRGNCKGSLLNNLRGHLNLKRWNHPGEQGNQQQRGDIPGLSFPEKPQETSPERGPDVPVERGAGSEKRQEVSVGRYFAWFSPTQSFPMSDSQRTEVRTQDLLAGSKKRIWLKT
ncbi:MAG TPA: hypothetical protein VKR06_29100, partial [Ktedonosporobacter sp.]|nr:hypothetical protein [Ktedonosporobacter sp.]